ncbi:MAG: GNAT family N-acetyltransferase [Ardenticatenaceae bacterium]|nr:GNAT family N-acetyltransferase [Ardenticatenaceae bacterium]MCB9444649.1 GNAT family N-acetyltransferase [Ardenticatenaceae bacterium]
MNHTLRDLNEADLPTLADLVNQVYVEPMGLTQLRDWYNRRPEGQIRRSQVVVDPAGRLIGYNLFQHEAWEEEGLFYVEVIVKPDWQGRGWGSWLYDEMVTAVATLGGKKLKGDVRDDRPDWLRFAQNRGFSIRRHWFESVIDLGGFDERPFTGLVESLEASGIRFFSLADVGDTEEARRELHAVNAAVSADTPGFEGQFMPFEAFNEMFNTASWFRPKGQILAADGDEYIGLAAVSYFAETNSMHNEITGVLPDYRGRKIAQALKLLTIRYAKAFGAATIRTNNDSENAPMLAINRKLGYKPRPGKYLLHKQL